MPLEGRLDSTISNRPPGQLSLAWAEAVDIIPTLKCGCSSVVEHLLAKEDVASSSLVTRSTLVSEGKQLGAAAAVGPGPFEGDHRVLLSVYSRCFVTAVRRGPQSPRIEGMNAIPLSALRHEILIQSRRTHQRATCAASSGPVANVGVR